MKPVIAISMGDPGGVGPEVTAKALASPGILDVLTPVVVGDEFIMRIAYKLLGLQYNLQRIESTDQARSDAQASPMLFQPYTTCAELCSGGISAENGKASCSYITSATREVLEKRADAICTAPISKEAIKLAGVHFPGHTEMLASLCGLNSVRMMLAGGGLKVVLQTIHVALKDVPSLITREAVGESLRMIRTFAVDNHENFPRIAVCGLNPHAGEAGQFGTEEIEVISPAVQKAKAEGLNVTGPVPADTVFHRALNGEFDYVLAMYHDQALIPVKTLDFHGGVNVTLGLPLIRTSPDHGTAFDLAGKGIANESSMVAALKYAAQLVQKRTV